MRVIHVSNKFPLNRQMRKAVRRGKLQVVRMRDELSPMGGGIPHEMRRAFRTSGSAAVCMAESGTKVGGGASFWKVLDNPGDSHPDVTILREVDKILAKAEMLPSIHRLGHHFKKRLDILKDDLKQRAERIQNHRHAIVFVGTVGHGKTSAICGFAEMLFENRRRGKNKPLSKEPVLLTAAGRTTLCEVRIIRGNQFKLVVDPCSDKDVEAHVADFCSARFAELNPDSKKDDEDDKIISPEMDRAIYNMAGFKKDSNDSLDPMKLAEKCGTEGKMKERVLSMMIMPRRRQVEMTCANLEELHDGYKAINNGKESKFSIPRQVDVIVPFSLLGDVGKKSGLEITLVDTKGVDAGASSRPDLERHFDADDTIVVLCSRFNNAPGGVASELLKRAKAKKMDGNIAEIASKTSILVLPRADESENTMRPDGDLVESREEAYEIQAERVKPIIRQLAVGEIPFLFYDWKEDDAKSACTFLFERVESLREFHRKGLRELIETVCEMMDNHEKGDFQAQQEEAAHQLEIWLRTNEIRESNARVHDELLRGIRGTSYASSLRAAVNRSGMWHNFDYYHFLGIGAQEIIKNRIEEWRRDFHAIAKQVENDDRVAKAHKFVRQVRLWVDAECEKLLVGVYEKSGEIFKTALVLEAGPEATRMWEKCRHEWGQGIIQGKRYKDRIEEHAQMWFTHSNVAARSTKLVEEYFLNQWRGIQKQLLARLSVGDTE